MLSAWNGDIGGKGSNGENTPGGGSRCGSEPRAIGKVKPSSLVELSRKLLIIFASWLVLADLPRGGGVKCVDDVVEDAASDFRFDFISTTRMGLVTGESTAEDVDD